MDLRIFFQLFIIISMNKYAKGKDNAVVMDNREYILKFRDLSVDEQPREKLMKHGPDILTLAELLAVVLNTGNKSEDIMELTNRIMKEYGEKIIIAQKNPGIMAKELDISIVKACQIIACGEIGRRFYEKKDNGFILIRKAQDAYDYLVDMRKLPKEHLRGLYLNNHNRIIHDEVISIGTINSNLVHPREVFRPAIEHNAVALVLAHNHPSNIVTPSESDIEVTNQLIKASKILGINILDHIIITKDKFMSIKTDY